MSWRVELTPTAHKQFSRLDKKTRARIAQELRQLQDSDNPLRCADVRPLTGELRGDYRLRIGDLRLLFTPAGDEHILHFYAILPRGRAYR
ncbi:MAG: type II toxin-antitoxin system RelE family toxin [Candidatus Geothermincolia bacterium]